MVRRFSVLFELAMTSRDCFYCGRRVAAGKSVCVLFLDGRGYPPTDSEIILYAQLCDTTIKHDAGHAALRRGISEIACNSFACYRLVKDVNNYVVSNVRVTRSVGEASSSTPILPAHRKVLTAAEKAAAALEEAAAYPLGTRGGISSREVTLIHKSALEPAELHSLGAAPQQSSCQSVHIAYSLDGRSAGRAPCARPRASARARGCDSVRCVCLHVS